MTLKRPMDIAVDIEDYVLEQYLKYGIECITRYHEEYKSEEFIEIVIRIPKMNDFLKPREEA